MTDLLSRRPGRAPINVLVVDDSVVVRRMVKTVLDEADDIVVMGTASDGRLALQRIEASMPDVVTLDVEMPNLNGLETLKLLRERWPELPVIMFTTLTEKDTVAALDALALGANDYVTKPTNMSSQAETAQAVRDNLVPLVRHWGRTSAARMPRRATPTPVVRQLPVRGPDAMRRTTPPQVVLIGVSTGGPNALAELLPQLPATFPVPVLVVQHMPPVFTRTLAVRLDQRCPLHVKEANENDVLAAGTVYLAQGGWHMVPVRRGSDVVLRLDDGEPENFCRPAVDVTFRAAAKIWGPAALAVVLTGMGQDGLLGSQALAAAGATVCAQDEESSVVWGMAGAVARAGIAHEVLPLSGLADAIMRHTAVSASTQNPTRAFAGQANR